MSERVAIVGERTLCADSAEDDDHVRAGHNPEEERHQGERDGLGGASHCQSGVHK